MAGVLRRVFLCVLLLAGMVAGGFAQAAERRVALVVGNAQYQRGGALPAVAANAAAVAEALRQAGFDVTVANNQEHRGLVAALSHFASGTRGAELGLVYYSGLMLSMGGKSFLLPTDAKLESEYDVVFDAIELDQLLQQMQAPKRGVVLLDAAMPNPLADKLGQAMAASGRSVRPVPGAPGPADTLLIGYAHQPDSPPAAASGGGPGPFAAALAQELVKPGADLRGALAAVERSVATRTNGAQKPWMQDRLGPTVALLPPAAAPSTAMPLPMPAPMPDVKLEVKVEPLEGSFVTVRDTNMRQGPDIKEPVLRTVARGTTVTATGQARRGGWTRVTVDGQQGFISTANLKRPDTPGEPAEPPSGAVAAAPAGPTGILEPGVHRVLRSATLFDRPAMGARGLRELPAGMPVTVLEPVPGSNWVRVRDRSEREGYVTAGTLIAAGEPPPPASAPTAVVNREEALALSGSAGGPPPSGPEVASVSAARGIPEQGPVPEAVRVARNSAAAGENAAAQARTAAQRATEAQRYARDAAATARTGTPRAWVHRFANGDVYEGEWAMVIADGIRQAHRSGHGIYRFADGQIYEGEWRDDQMAGVGIMVFRTGDRYAGTFRGGQPEGLGVYRYANGDGYAGEVRRNRPEGPGEMSYANGDRYQGQVADRRPSGYGALTLNGTGGRHLGRFREGAPEGPGIATSVDGVQRSGVWQGSRVVSE